MDSLIDIIAEHVSNNYTFINSDGEEYQPDGYFQATSFIEEIIIPQVDDFIKARYDIKDD